VGTAEGGRIDLHPSALRFKRLDEKFHHLLSLPAMPPVARGVLRLAGYLSHTAPVNAPPQLGGLPRARAGVDRARRTLQAAHGPVLMRWTLPRDGVIALRDSDTIMPSFPLFRLATASIDWPLAFYDVGDSWLSRDPPGAPESAGH
jgi:hypothetical protein